MELRLSCNQDFWPCLSSTNANVCCCLNVAFGREGTQTCPLYFIYPWKLHCHNRAASMQTLFHSHSKLSSHSSQDTEWSPSEHILMFLGVPLSVLPQQAAVCPHQSSDLSVVSHSSRVGISRCYLPVQVLARSPDLPFSAHGTQEPANLLKTLS